VSSRTAQPLHGRSEELAAIDAAIAGGGLLVLEGDPGVGKTSLLAEARRLAAASGLAVFSAAGIESEEGFPFGLVRRLLLPGLRALPTRTRSEVMSGAAALAAPVLDGTDTEPQDSDFAVLHGLYWVASNLIDLRAAAICIDDLQWADPASLRFVAFLTGRLDALDACLLVGTRHSGAADLLAGGERLVVRELGADESTALVTDILGADATPEVCAACHRASGGNPFLLTTLLGQLARDGVGAAGDIPDLPVEEVGQVVSRRLAALGDDATRLARATAVLGGAGALADAADIAGLDAGHASRALDALAGARLMVAGEPLRFVHPLILASIRDGLAYGERGLLHAAAARTLRRRGRPPEAVAAHLLHAPAAADPDAVRILREAAHRALAWGQPSTAAALLHRAREEPPAETERAAVLLELARAATRADGEAGLPVFADAAAAARDARAEVEVAIAHAAALAELGRFDELDSVVEAARLVLPDDAEDLATGLGAADAALLISPEHAPAAAGRLFERTENLVPRNPVEGGLLASRAYVDVVLGLHDEAGPRAAAAVTAMTADAAARHSEMTLYHACHSAVFSEQFDVLDRALARFVEVAQRTGDHKRYALTRLAQAWVAEIRGDLPGCVSLAREALDGFSEGEMLWRINAHAQLVHTLSMVGDYDAAEEMVRSMRAFRVDDMPPVMDPSPNEAILRVQQGRPAEANPIFDRLAPIVTANQPPPFYHAAVVARRAAGRHDDALALATEYHARVEAHPGGPYARGMALRCLAAAHAGDQRETSLLRDALEHFETSVARFRQAECAVALGSALRRAGKRAEARPHLRTGLELAQHCGARPLAEFAAEELGATGERVRRGGLLTRDELTPSELRVCRMAVAGATNAEVAQALFVTKKTVETHLSSAYRKLGIRSRDELAAALPAEP
jgi:DNA-binding CsgD family transcriptional regulator